MARYLREIVPKGSWNKTHTKRAGQRMRFFHMILFHCLRQWGRHCALLYKQGNWSLKLSYSPKVTGLEGARIWIHIHLIPEPTPLLLHFPVLMPQNSTYITLTTTFSHSLWLVLASEKPVSGEHIWTFCDHFHLTFLRCGWKCATR